METTEATKSKCILGWTDFGMIIYYPPVMFKISPKHTFNYSKLIQCLIDTYNCIFRVIFKSIKVMLTILKSLSNMSYAKIYSNTSCYTRVGNK